MGHASFWRRLGEGAGQLTRKTKPDGGSLWYQYDAGGRLTRITEL
jgi:YD repeat-containing protein